MSASLKWRYQPPPFGRVKRHNLTQLEGILRGVGREYSDAKRLGLIDPRIAPLVDLMNASDLLRTVACCEGHGGWGSFSSPYVAFRGPVELSAMLHEKLETDAISSRSRLNFHWTIAGYFWDSREVAFRLSVVGIERYRWVSRRRLDGDINNITDLTRGVISEFRETVRERNEIRN